ncbi:hypothetical protein ABVT39_022898 [Epinephelus coioides]
MAKEGREYVFPHAEGLHRFIAPFTPQAIPPSQSERGERTALPEATRAVERAAEREKEREREGEGEKHKTKAVGVEEGRARCGGEERNTERRSRRA